MNNSSRPIQSRIGYKAIRAWSISLILPDKDAGTFSPVSIFWPAPLLSFEFVDPLHNDLCQRFVTQQFLIGLMACFFSLP